VKIILAVLFTLMIFAVPQSFSDEIDVIIPQSFSDGIEILASSNTYSEANLEFTEVTIIPAPGSGIPGCEETSDGCFIPNTTTVEVGGVVTMTNADAAGMHTYTSGTVDGFAASPDEIFDSGVLQFEQSFELDTTDMEVGEYPYYCMLHVWMQGVLIVNNMGSMGTIIIQTDKPQYNEIEEIQITGTIHNITPDPLDTITLDILDHYNDNLIPTITDIPITNDTFSYNLITDDQAWREYKGTIQIQATLNNNTASTTFSYSDWPLLLSLESLYTAQNNLITFLQNQIDFLMDKIITLEMEEEHSLFCGNIESHYNLIMGTNQADTLYGTDGPDLFFGENGHDVMYGYGGGDCAFGDNGGDTFHGGDGDDGFYGGHGDNLFYGGAGNDTAYGSEGNNTCYDVEILNSCNITTPDPEPIVEDEPTSEQFPTIKNISMQPWKNMVPVGNDIILTIHETNAQTGLTLNGIATINYVDVTNTFKDNNDGTYTLKYTVSANDSYLEDNQSMPLSITLNDKYGTPFYTANSHWQSIAPGVATTEKPIISKITLSPWKGMVF